MAAAPSGGALPPPLTLVVQVAGEADIPADAVGVALNVTVTEPLADGFLTVYPCGDRPLASNLNYLAGQTVPNFVVAGLDADGAVCIDTMSTTDVVVDLAGYIPAGSSLTPLPAPVRFLDTRVGLGAPQQQVAGLTVTEVPLAGGFGVPADARSAVFNVTVVDPVADGYISVFPCDRGRVNNGGTSTSNFRAGEIVPNLVAIGVGEEGKVCVYSTVETDLVADVAAFVPAGGAGLTTLGFPRRLVDTRFGVGGQAVPLDSNVRTVAVGGVHGVPVDATAAIVNITATDGSSAGYITAFPCGQPAPLVSNVNFSAGQEVANLAVVALGAGGEMCMRSMVPVGVVVDITGYIEGTDALVAIEPTRLYDSREGVDPSCGLAVRFMVIEPIPGYFQLLYKGGGWMLLPDQPDWDGWGQGAFIDQACHVYVAGILDLHIHVYEYLPTGEFVREFRVLDGSLRRASATSQGLIGLGIGTNSIVELETGRKIAAVPVAGPQKPWNWVGASDDGSIMAITRVGANDEVEVMYWDQAGNGFGPVVFPAGSRIDDISRDGNYLLVGSRQLHGDQVTVTTLTGVAIATLPNTFTAQFMTDGSIAACVDPPGNAPMRIMRWDIFTAPQPYGAADWPMCDVLYVR